MKNKQEELQEKADFARDSMREDGVAIGKQMIVKVQQALNNNKVLVYNEDKSISYEGKMPKKVKKIMGNRLKVYFGAQMVGSEISLNYPVNDRGW